MENKKFSVITVTLNNLEGLKKTQQSLTNQTYRNFEWIIIDGGSGDGTAQWLKQNESNIDQWVSEPDTGIYQAMNKGISKASGEYLIFLNSGDYFVSQDVLEQAIQCNLDADLVYGNLQIEETKEVIVYPDQLRFNFLFFDALPHQASFIRKKSFEKFGYYDESKKIVADWSWMLEAIALKGATTQHIPVVCSVFNLQGMSNNPKFRSRAMAEREGFLKTKFGVFYQDYLDLKKYRLFDPTLLIPRVKKKLRRISI